MQDPPDAGLVDLGHGGPEIDLGLVGMSLSATDWTAFFMLVLISFLVIRLCSRRLAL